MTLEEDLGYNLAGHLGLLKEKYRLLISDKHDEETIDRAAENLEALNSITAEDLIQDAFENSGRQDDSPLRYLKLSVYALEQDLSWIYAHLGPGMEKDLDFFKEFSF